MSASVDVERARKPVKTLFGWLLFRRISLPLSIRVARGGRIRPAHLTALGLALGLAGAASFALGTRAGLLAGAGLALVAKLLDAMDGEVARATRRDTRAGYVADGLADRLRDTSLIVGAGVGLHRTGFPGALSWTLAAATGYLAFFYVSGAFPAHWREVRSPGDLAGKHMFLVAPGIRLGAGDTLAVLVAAAAVAGRIEWFLQTSAVAAPVALALKIARLFRLRPWEAEAPLPPQGAERAGRRT
ncbi:MAG: CDP-alcohol phosphatidyltransferase family protein [Acidobacteria bacterium]|nr:CDP-alcohol phosphatidyltransferase family protein [Acidobacteriota bacterium]